MVIRYMENGDMFYFSLEDGLIPQPGDCVEIHGVEHLVVSRKFDFDDRVVYVNVKRVRNEIED